MELRDIEYFAIVAEQRHLGRAAAILGLSQPALSKSLRRLELSLQVRLVRRTPKGIELTEEGSALLMRVQELRLAFQSVAREIADVSQGHVGHLRIGASPAVSQHFLSASFAAFLEHVPRARLKVLISDNDVMIPALRNGELDLIVNYVIPPLPEGVTSKHLFDDDQLVCASTKHRLAGKHRLTIADLEQEQWALSEPTLESSVWLQGRFRDAGLRPPRILLESRSVALRLRTVASSKLLTFASRGTIELAKSSRLPLTPLDVGELTRLRQIGAIFRKEAYLPPVVGRFIDILTSQAANKAASRRLR
jgi:DNA-binding transcriptional LysR family regulator